MIMFYLSFKYGGPFPAFKASLPRFYLGSNADVWEIINYLGHQAGSHSAFTFTLYVCNLSRLFLFFFKQILFFFICYLGRRNDRFSSSLKNSKQPDMKQHIWLSQFFVEHFLYYINKFYPLCSIDDMTGVFYET